jgi:hypothetical protein
MASWLRKAGELLEAVDTTAKAVSTVAKQHQAVALADSAPQPTGAWGPAAVLIHSMPTVFFNLVSTPHR